MRKLWTSLLFPLLLLCCFQSVASGKIVLIIDDIGYHKQDIEAVDLPGNVTLSVLPGTPYGKEYASRARLKGRDVMLHIPMESLSGKALGPSALTTRLSEDEFNRILSDSLEEIPFAIGINNHMGSLLTQLPEQMDWTMSFLKSKQLFFLDSRTTKYSQAKNAANKYGVTYFRRHVFIDNVRTEDAMKAQFESLIRLAEHHDIAVGIAHPYKESIAFFKKHLPTLERQGIQLVKVSDMLLQVASATGSSVAR